MATDARLIEKAVTAAGLAARYAQPHRHYHTMTHVKHVLETIDQLSPEGGDDDAVRLAAWFHDAIYAPGRQDNEQRSAYLARDILELVGASPKLGTEVSRLILLTSHHDPDPADAVGSMLSDADLKILAEPWSTYAEYTWAIRREYELIPDDEFRPARARILKGFLQQPAIYRLPTSYERWESLARANVTREINELESTP
ncbi:MAG TPA: metal-dependent phosphohydrolase [Actinomycetes bacterium]|nr:metal-dependent phosphohydrolase [Actinomycetes bacterium]